MRCSVALLAVSLGSPALLADAPAPPMDPVLLQMGRAETDMREVRKDARTKARQQSSEQRATPPKKGKPAAQPQASASPR